MNTKVSEVPRIIELLRDPIEKDVQKTNQLIFNIFSKSKKGLSLEESRKKIKTAWEKSNAKDNSFYLRYFVRKEEFNRTDDVYAEKLLSLLELKILNIVGFNSSNNPIYSLTEKGISLIQCGN